MYHWYLLAKGVTKSGASTQSPGSGFVVGGGPAPMGGLTSADRRKMIGLGAVETVPLIGCVVAGPLLSDGVPRAVWFAVGLALMTAVCWLFRGQTPQEPIHVFPEATSNATTDGVDVSQSERHTDTEIG